MLSSILERAQLVAWVFCSCFTLSITLILCETTARSQIITTTTSVTDGKTPAALRPGSPAGSYALSGFDNVNLFNGNLNFHLPLLQVGGRGSTQTSVTLALNLKGWRIKHTHKEMPDGNTIDSYVPTHTGWLPHSGYGPGRLDSRNYGLQTSSNMSCRWYSKTLTRLTFSASDGTEYELRDDLTKGEPRTSTCTQGASRGTVFVTADGSAATFVSDAPIYDNPTIGGVGPQGPTIVTGFLMLKDGTRYRIDNGSVTWIRDRNGNKITFAYSTNSMTITDQLSRTVTVNYDVSDVAPYGLCDQIIYKGFGGAQRVLRVSHTNLGNVLRPNSGYSIRTLGGPSGLFPETNGSSSTTYDPTVTSVVWLPNGRSYKFYYNSYAELARVELPTGGAYEYDMTPGSGVICLNYCWPEDDRQIYRRVVERRVYSNGSSGASFDRKETYTNSESVGTDAATVTVEQVGPTGTVVARSRHFFDGSALNSLFGGAVASTYPAWYEGNEKQSELLDTSGNIASATVLRRVVTSRQQRIGISWWPAFASTYGLNVNKEPPNDPRVTDIVTTIEPSSANLVSKQVFGYDDSVPFNNRNNLKEYGFGVGAAGALVRETRTTYQTNSTYTDTNVHIRNLTTQISVFGGATERSRASIAYDNYNADTYHAGLLSRSNISGFDSAFTTGYTTRGNATSSTAYVLVNGSVTGSVSTYTQYDIAGSPVKIIDARSTPSNVIATNIEYDDRYGSPDGDARGNTVPAELTSLQSFAFPTKVINPLGHVSYAQFDYYIGAPVNGEDANAVVSSGYFNDPLDRPTQIRLAVGMGDETQTTFSYDDVNRIVTTSSDLDVNGDNVLVSKVVYDQMGRTIENRQYESVSSYIVTETQYDALGRAYKTSKPYRWQSQTAEWTTQAFDALGRVISVTTPDLAVVSTVYSGNTVTVTDQAGRSRKSVTDALGRLVEVYEDPNGLNYQTTYLYDVLDNLVKVTQGSQQRFFMYDSLKRLIRARNPEQVTRPGLSLSDPITGNSAWCLAYEYDANSNLTQRTDPRGVVSTYAYDALNRITTVDYSDTGSINPDVKRFYDGATNGKGRFWYFYTGGDYYTGANVDSTSVDSYDALGRPTVQRQLFKLNNTWGPTYQISRAYNRAGSVKSQTYPSGHSVTYNYDNAGRLADKDAQNLAFKGNLGDGVQRTYSSAVTYTAPGNLSTERFGTQMPLYHKLQYNIREQLWDVRVSTAPDVNGSWNRGALQFFYEPTYTHGASGPTNNGNVLKTNHYVPFDESSSTWAIHDQLYTYDALNRLSSVSEYFISSTRPLTQQSLQSYTYDRYGNRTINPASWGTGINEKQFTVDAATNRLGVPVGQSGVMDYDEAGNLKTDTYSGMGNRTYDAENHMTTTADFTGQTSRYTYDADGKRTRRQVASSQEQWYIYGFDGELLAEYRAASPYASPEKEYGYRNGQLLVTATGRFNVALAANGAVATASSAHTCCGFSTTGAINGNNRGPWGNGEGWNDATENQVPDWLQVEFAGSKTIDEISVFSLHDNYTQENTPTETQTFSLYGLLAFDVQYWNGSSWVTIPGGSVTGNNKVWRKFTFSPITTDKIRVYITSVPDAWSRVVEIQAFGTSAGGEKVQWLVPDHLGTPRIIIDETGSRANVKRHDYLPFGEELFAGTGGRTAALGYLSDGVRQQFTSQERDVETGLDYFHARYYSSVQGRFISVDPLLASAEVGDPQTWNRYSYVSNKPLGRIDPYGLDSCTPKAPCVRVPESEWRTVGPVVDGGTVTITSGAEPITTTDIQPITDLQVMTGQENPVPQDGLFMTVMDSLAGVGGGSLAATLVGTQPGNPSALGAGAAVVGGMLAGALLYDLAKTIAGADAIPIPAPRSRQQMTFYHYTTAGPAAFVNGLLPGSSASDHPGLTAESARAGLGIPVLPTLVYPVTIDPQTTPYSVSVVPPHKYGPGGLLDYYFPKGTPAGSVGIPKPVTSFKVP